jgi:serine/threonine protein kinase/tetratricopeptide (TPR) repeat protein
MIGQVLLHYRIVDKLGQGGMGVVYRAEDLKLKRSVALKFLSPEFSRRPGAREGFLTEARAASALNHPNICTVHAVEEVFGLPATAGLPPEAESGSQLTVPMTPAGDDSMTAPLREGSAPPAPAETPIEEGAPFIVMEYVKGTPLSLRIRKGPLSTAECIDITFQIAQGLNEAHAHGVVHRDIKPSNVMVTPSGLVKIMDFGLAKMDGEARESEAGVTMGTLAYMSPEQLQQRPVDHRTDLFSLGVLLYESLSGKKPFAGKNRAGLFHAITEADPLSPSEAVSHAPRGLQRILARCLQKDPERRYSSCRELLAELEEIRTQLAESALTERPGEDESSSKRESERRQATVMFGEIRARGEKADVLESSDVVFAVDDLMGRLAAITSRYGGTLDRVLGGDFTFLFGLGAAAEHSPRRALQAALAIRGAVDRSNARLAAGARIAVRIGINTGPVLAVSLEGGGPSKFSVLGDTVVVASRLKDRAQDGQICVGAATHRQTHRDYEFAALSPIALEGRTEPAPAFEFLRARGREAASDRAVGARMFGRENELERLKQSVLSLFEGTGGIVNVIGEPGLGKSRLLAELLRWEGGQRVAFLEGHALSTGRNLAYHPVIDLLRSWARIREDDSKPEAFRKLESAVRAVHPEGFLESLPFIATLMGMSLPEPYAERLKGIEGEALGRLVLKAVRELMERASERRPLAIVVEDLHWADLSTIELLEGLMRSPRNHRILFINTFRPNYPETSDRLQETIRDRYAPLLTEITLRPLDALEARRLIQNLLDVPSLPATFLDRIVQRAEGNPLFLEEVMRSLIDEGAVVPADGGFNVTEKIETVVIPDTIQEILMARLDLLEESRRTVLKVAAVIGRHFFLKVLAAVAPSPETLGKCLADLVAVQLLTKSERGDEVEYSFRHALVQEAVYECILPPKRKELHLQVAAAIETVFADRLSEFYGRLAFHYSNGDSPQNAERVLVLAGEEAVKAAAPSEALFYFQEALVLYLRRFGGTGDPERTAQLEKAIGLAFHNKGRMVEAVTHFDRALECWDAAPPHGGVRQLLRLAADLSSILVRLYVTKKNPSRLPTRRDNDIIEVIQKKGTALVAFDSRRYFLESVGVLRRMNGFDLAHVTNGPAFYAVTSALFSVPAVSFAISRRILDYARRFVDANDPRTLLYYRFAELLHDLMNGEWNRPEAYDESLVAENRKLGEVWFASVYVLCFGLLAVERGRWGEAEEYASKLAELGDVYENDLIRARMDLLRSRLLLKQRKLEPALEAAERSATLLAGMDQAMLLVYVWGLKGQAQVLLGDTAAARATFAEADALVAKKERIPPYYGSSLDVARLRFALQPWPREGETAGANTAALAEPALSLSRAALRSAKNNAMDRTEILRLVGLAKWWAGQRNDARALLERSLNAGQELGAEPEVKRTREELARLG